MTMRGLRRRRAPGVSLQKFDASPGGRNDTMIHRWMQLLGLLAIAWLAFPRDTAAQPRAREIPPQQTAPFPIPDSAGFRSRVRGCPSIEEIQAASKALNDVKLQYIVTDSEVPPDCSQVLFTGSEAATTFGRAITMFQWEPTNFFHQPLYFEDMPLERYGQTVCPHLQPVISGTRFFLTFPIMPYKLGVQHPHDCVTILGFHRPGNCAPCVREVLPLDGHGAFLQTATTLGFIFLLP